MKIDFRRTEELYVETYSNGLIGTGGTVLISEFDVPLPDMPEEKYMENYNLKTKDQKFIRRPFPRDLKQWDPIQRNEFIDAQYHRRRNGFWILIKGEPFYITGSMYFFMTSWMCEYGGLPQFRMEATEFFLFWRMCELDPDCYGMLDYKARRLGDTEKALCLEYDYGTTYRHTRCGMQNLSEDDAADNLQRIVDAHIAMPWFFKPVSRGQTRATSKLILDFPSEQITKKKLIENRDEVESYTRLKEKGILPIQSIIDYKATRLKKYDGKRLGRFHLDEAGKMVEMDPVKQLEVIQPCLHLNGGKQITGKAIVTTTVEEIKNGKSLEYAKTMWEESNPMNRTLNGRTVNGLYRVFRSVLLASEVDEYGFHKKKEMAEFIKNEADMLFKSKKLRKLADFKRKNPLSIDDVLQPSAEDCILFPMLLDHRMKQIEEKLSVDDQPLDRNGKEVVPKGIRGDLVWINGNMKSLQVKWVPNPNGKWNISQQPKIPNCMTFAGGVATPGQRWFYGIGVDPYDHMLTSGRRSDGAIAVYKKYNPEEDQGLEHDEHGEIMYPDQMQSDQFVCTYAYRHEEPNKFYEDVMKTVIYYGAQCLYESNKPGIRQFFLNMNMMKYLMLRPNSTKNTITQSTNSTESGTPSSTPVISLYIEALQDHISRRINTAHHMDLLRDWRKFTGENRTDCDLTVASGMALIAGGKRYGPSPNATKSNGKDLQQMPWRTVRRNV